MTKSIEISAKKVEDAIKQGLEQLGASLDEAEVTVLDAGGFLRKAKVRLTIERDDDTAAEEKPIEQKRTEAPKAAEPQKAQAAGEPAQSKKPTEAPAKKAKEKQPAPKRENEQPSQKKSEAENEQSDELAPQKRSRVDNAQAMEKAAEFVGNIVAKMGFEDAKVCPDGDECLNITAADGDDSLIIGRHGETLSALSYLAEITVRAEKCHVNITVDCNGYRGRRAASLTAMAKRRANECAAKQRKIRLEPMERIDRRTVHNALTDDDRVITASEGKEPKRYVVIMPKKA